MMKSIMIIGAGVLLSAPVAPGCCAASVVPDTPSTARSSGLPVSDPAPAAASLTRAF